jgi:hypothetical protein
MTDAGSDARNIVTPRSPKYAARPVLPQYMVVLSVLFSLS